MKKILTLVCVLVLALSSVSAFAAMEDYNIVTSAETHKVIFDTDMGYFGDDTYALFILLQADAAGYIDLLGVTSVGANVTIAEGTTAILNQLEAVGREDIPVYMGTDVPIMGFRNMAAERELWGAPEYSGAYWDFSTGDFFDVSQRPTNYLDLPSEPTYGYPETAPQDGHAIDFIIEQVHK